MNYNKNVISLFVCLLFIAHITHINASKIPLEIEINNKNSQPSSSKKIEKAPEFVDKKYIKYIKKNIEIMEEQEATAMKKLLYYNKIPCPYDIEKAKNMFNDVFDGDKEEWVKFLASCAVKFMIKYHTLQKEEDNTVTQVQKLLETYNYITSNYLKILNETNQYSIGISIQDIQNTKDSNSRDIMREELLFSLIKYGKKNTIEDELQKYFQYLVNLWNQANEETKKEIEKRIYKFIQCSGYYGFFEYALPYLTPNLANNCTLDEALLNNILVFINQSISSEFSGIDKKEVFNKIYSTLDLLLSKQIEEKKYKAGNVKKMLEDFTITCHNQSKQLLIECYNKGQSLIKNKVQTLETELSDYKKQKTAVEKELDKFQQQAINAKTELANIVKQKTTLEKEFATNIAAHERQKNELLAKQQELQDKINQFEKQEKINEKTRIQFQSDLKSRNEEIILYKKEITELKEDNKNKDVSYKTLAQIVEQLEQKTKDQSVIIKQTELSKRQYEDAKKKIELLEQCNKGITKEHEELKKANEQLKQQLETANKQLQLFKPIEKLKTTESMQKANEQLEKVNKQPQVFESTEQPKPTEQKQIDQIDKEKVITNLKQIQEEYKEAKIQSSKFGDKWQKSAVVIANLVEHFSSLK